MNILLLGTRGAGKTTLMHSMYGHFQTHREGLTIQAIEGHEKLIEGYKAISKGIYPSASNKREKYKMELKYWDEKLLEFSWIDYHGGIYEDNFNWEKSEIEKLESDILNSDGVLCFFDSTNYSKTNEYFVQTIQMLGSILINVKRVYPVSFVVTKADLLDEPLSKGALIKPLKPIIENMTNNGKICGSLFQSSCGKKFQNIDLPLFFMLIFGVLIKDKRERKEIEDRKKELHSRSIWADIGDWVDSKWNGYSTDYELLDERIDNFNKKIEIRSDAIQRMAKRLDNAIVFPENIDDELFS